MAMGRAVVIVTDGRMNRDRLVPRVGHVGWWRSRIPATVALLCAVSYMYGGASGWLLIEGREANGPWRTLLLHGSDIDYVARYPEAIEAHVIFAYMLPAIVLWLWAPLGGHVGRLLTLACVVILLGFVTSDAIGRSGDRAVVDALLERNGWARDGLGAGRPLINDAVEIIEGSVEGVYDVGVANDGLVTVRERVLPGAAVSLIAAVGGLTVSTGSLLAWVASVLRTVVRQVGRGSL